MGWSYTDWTYIALPTIEMCMHLQGVLELMYQALGFLRATAFLNQSPGSSLRASSVINCKVASFSVYVNHSPPPNLFSFWELRGSG